MNPSSSVWGRWYPYVGGLLVGVPIVIAVFIWSFWCFPEHRKEIEFLRDTVAWGGGVVGAFLVVISIQLQVQTNREQRSFEHLTLLNKQAVSKTRVFVRQAIFEKELSPDAAGAVLVADPENYAGVISLLGILEDMSLAVQREYVDEERLFHSMQYMVPRLYEMLTPIIEYEEKSRKGEVLFTDLKALVEAWKAGKLLTTGKTISERL